MRSYLELIEAHPYDAPAPEHRLPMAIAALAEL
jgi:hypothetical protein